MSDLFDAAKPARDAIIREMRAIAPPEISETERDGLELGIHLIAVLTAFGAARHGKTAGAIRDAGLSDVMTCAFGVAIANAASTYRPVRAGEPISMGQNARELLCMIGAYTAAQVKGAEDGLVVPLALDKAGRLGPEEFDLSRYSRGRRE